MQDRRKSLIQLDQAGAVSIDYKCKAKFPNTFFSLGDYFRR